MKNLMKLIFALFVAGSLASCAIGPTAKLADGSMVTLGGSLATEASADARSLTMPNGFAMNWVRGNVNETKVLNTAIMAVGTAAVASHAADTAISNNNVKNVAAGEATKQVGLKEATKQLEIKTAAETSLGMEALKAAPK